MRLTERFSSDIIWNRFFRPVSSATGYFMQYARGGHFIIYFKREAKAQDPCAAGADKRVVRIHDERKFLY